MEHYKTDKILSVGDRYRNGTIINIESEDGGWIITIQYKNHTKQVFLYHN